MSTSKSRQKLALAGRLIKHTLRGQKLRHLTVEVTKRCNAKCYFCNYWKEPPREELADYGPVVRHFNPLVVTLSGGEPLLRDDLEEVVAGIRRADPHVYLGMVTNAALLDVERARELHRAGLDQLSISLDYNDEKHGRVRALPGLYGRITALLPELREAGFHSVGFNTVIKDDNLDSIPGILDLAVSHGVQVGFSSYCELKTGNPGPMVSEQNGLKLAEIISLIKDYKRKHSVTRTSDYYLDRVEDYFSNNEIRGCRAGQSWVQVTPAGEIKPCSELPVAEKDYRGYAPSEAKPVSCTACWYSCRGESQAPVTLGRVRELL